MQRLIELAGQLTREKPKAITGQVLRVFDNRTKKVYEVPVKEAKDCFYISSKDIGKITDKLEQPLRMYDPGYMNTISCTSKISYIDGIRGVLEYRGYRIQQLAKNSTFSEVAFLLIYGQLPCPEQLEEFSEKYKIQNHTMVHTDVNTLIKSFRHDAHPMSMLISTLSAYSTLKPGSNPSIKGEGIHNDPAFQNKQIYRLLGIVPTIAAMIHRHRMGRDFNLPQKSMSYAQNFLYMLDKLNQKDFKPHPKLVKALDVLFILHAQHEVGCSTSFIRHLASTGVDIYTAIALAAGALYGPKHGGANSAVIKMLQSIGTKQKIRRFLMQVKLKRRTLYGFGNRVYKNYDPRAKIIKQIAFDVFQVCGKEPLIEIALQLQRIALQDDYFITRKLYPNVDFYSGLIYRAMGFTIQMLPLLYTIPRVAGWIAHWIELLKDKENNLYRPRQNYVGSGKRQFVQMSERKQHSFETDCSTSKKGKRRQAAQRYQQSQKDE